MSGSKKTVGISDRSNGFIKNIPNWLEKNSKLPKRPQYGFNHSSTETFYVEDRAVWFRQKKQNRGSQALTHYGRVQICMFTKASDQSLMLPCPCPHREVRPLQVVCVQRCICWCINQRKFKLHWHYTGNLHPHCRPCMSLFVLSRAGAIHPSLRPPRSPSFRPPLLLYVGGVSGGRRRRLLQWQ